MDWHCLSIIRSIYDQYCSITTWVVLIFSVPDLSFGQIEAFQISLAPYVLFDRFEKVFGPETSQLAVYDSCAKEVLARTLEGQNASILAYGPTGAGTNAWLSNRRKDFFRPVKWLVTYTALRSNFQWNVFCSIHSLDNNILWTSDLVNQIFTWPNTIYHTLWTIFTFFFLKTWRFSMTISINTVLLIQKRQFKGI